MTQKIWARLDALPTATHLSTVLEVVSLDPTLVPGRDIFTPDLIFVDATGIAGVAEKWTYDGTAFAAPAPSAPSIAQLSAILIKAASAACSSISAQVIPDQVHGDAYRNAATIVWANGGAAPTTDPAKTIFAQQAAVAGIEDPATFAKVVTNVSLASMQLSTILGSLQAALAPSLAKTSSDLAAALSTFEESLGAFVTGLNGAGLTVTITAPAAIAIAGLNA